MGSNVTNGTAVKASRKVCNFGCIFYLVHVIYVSDHLAFLSEYSTASSALSTTTSYRNNQNMWKCIWTWILIQFAPSFQQWYDLASAVRALRHNLLSHYVSMSHLPLSYTLHVMYTVTFLYPDHRKSKPSPLLLKVGFYILCIAY